MSVLRWSWTLRAGPYLRATVGSQPWLLAAPPLIGAGVALLGTRGMETDRRVLVGVVVTLLVALVWFSTTARQLRRRQRTARARVQDYALADDSLTLSVGRDSYTLPLSELVVSAHGRDWLAVRRQGAGRRPLLLFFDDPGRLPEVATTIRRRGAARDS